MQSTWLAQAKMEERHQKGTEGRWLYWPQVKRELGAKLARSMRRNGELETKPNSINPSRTMYRLVMEVDSDMKVQSNLMEVSKAKKISSTKHGLMWELLQPQDRYIGKCRFHVLTFA